MTAYHYIALNKDHKELSGIIEAPDDVSARKKLNELGFSVVALTVFENIEQSPAELQSGNVFEFEALDKNGKKVIGTIRANDPINAYSRLFDEYQLNIISLADSSRQKIDIAAIQSEYEKSASQEKKTREAVNPEESQNVEKKSLLEKVDFTIRRIEDFLKEFGDEIKNEERTAIQAYVDQLIRIKDSTNLEHIRTTCEKMLEHIQKQELFVHEEQKSRESTKIKVDTKTLLTDLKRSGLHKSVDIIELLTRLQTKPILRPLISFFLKLGKAHMPEILKLRGEIKIVNRQIWEYAKVLILGKSKTIRLEAWHTLGTLWQERRRLKMELKAKIIQAHMQTEESPESTYFRIAELGKIFGWILGFYLASYIISYPFTIKNINGLVIPKSFYFYASHLTKVITLSLFLAYGCLTVHNFWLRKKAAVYLLYPVAFFVYLLIVINLL